MKYIMTALAVFMLAACGASPNASKEDTAKTDLNAQLPVMTGADVWNIDTVASQLTFTANHNSRDFTGDFSNFAAAIRLDPANPEEGEVHAVIDLTSVDAGDRDRNANLPTKDWFHTASFPAAIFASENITALGGENYQAQGELSLKGMIKPVTLAFSLQVEGDSAVATGGTDLDRTEFNVGEGPDFAGEDWVKFPVKVQFVIKANK